jgi:natural product precursor
MKKLKLIKLAKTEKVSPEELKRLRGGSCQAWLCQCHGSLSSQYVDDVLEGRDRDGYL